MSRTSRIGLAIAAATAAGLAVTYAGYRIGAKAGHPWIGAVVAFVFVAPMVSGPVGLALGGDALESLAAESQARQTNVVASGPQSPATRPN